MGIVIAYYARLSIESHKMKEATKISQHPILISLVEIHDR